MFKGKIVIHVGYPKCASTLLQDIARNANGDFQYIGKYTDRDFFYRVADPEYFFDANDSLNHINRADKAIMSFEGFMQNPFFTRPGAGIYANRLKSMFPGGNVVIVIRNQVDMVASFIAELFAGGGSGRMSVDDFFKGDHLHRQFMFDLRYFDYWPAINHYLKLFGKENVQIILFEELIDNLDLFFRFCEDKLDTSISYENRSYSVRPRISSCRFWYLRLTNPWRRSFLNPAGGPFGIELPRPALVEAALERMARVVKAKKFEPLSDEHINIISQVCSGGNRRLCEFLGTDLSQYGYPVSGSDGGSFSWT